MLNVYVIGCGGIGGFVIDDLAPVISSLSLDLLECSGENIARYLADAGARPLPSVVDKITLIDADVFDPRNAIRQSFGAGRKLEQRMAKLLADNAFQLWLPNIKVKGYDAYVNPANIGKIIPLRPEANIDNTGTECLTQYGLSQGRNLNASVVFICVDNLKTRYEVSKYMEAFDDCLVINGGNSKTTGHVTLYERSGGKPLDPNIYEIYPNVRPDADKRPDEVECTQMSPKHDQVLLTNKKVALEMLTQFSRWLRAGLYSEERRRSGAKVTVRKNEIFIDTDNSAVQGLVHPLTAK